MKIDGYTISEMAELLGLPYRTVQKRLKRADIEPITTGAIYPKSALETIKDAPSPGRPPKAKSAPAKPASKAGKPK
jgi:predicted transcriptional regulator